MFNKEVNPNLIASVLLIMLLVIISYFMVQSIEVPEMFTNAFWGLLAFIFGIQVDKPNSNKGDNE